MRKYPAVFLDRDGTLINDVGYINKVSKVEIYSNTISALKKLQKHFLLFIITNQSGISEGLLSEVDVKRVNAYIEKKLKSKGVTIYHTFFCPHKTEDKCICRKPHPFFVNQAISLYNLDVSKSYIIGDHPSDVECGINSGITPIYVLTGHGEKHRSELNNTVQICDSILEASDYIISKLNN